MTTTEYCEKLQQWMWQYYSAYVNWHSWMSLFALSCPPPYFAVPSSSETEASSSRTDLSASDPRNWYNPLAFPVPPHFFPAPPASGNASQAGDTNVTQSTVPGPVQQPQQQQQQQQNGNAQQPGKLTTCLADICLRGPQGPPNQSIVVCLHSLKLSCFETTNNCLLRSGIHHTFPPPEIYGRNGGFHNFVLHKGNNYYQHHASEWNEVSLLLELYL